MKRTFVLLLIAAIGVWGYVAVRVVSALTAMEPGSGPESGATLSIASIRTRAAQPLDTSFRDPFQSYLYAQKPEPVKAKPKPGAAPKAAPPEPPKAALDGILWGDDPVAILKQDGQTELVKTGATVWGLKVIKIERDRVTVLKQGRKFVLGM